MGAWTPRCPACGCLVVPTHRPPSSAALGISRTRGQEQPPAGDPKIPMASLVPARGTTGTTLPCSQTLSPRHHQAVGPVPFGAGDPVRCSRAAPDSPQNPAPGCWGWGGGGSAPCRSSALRCQDRDHPNFGPWGIAARLVPHPQAGAAGGRGGQTRARGTAGGCGSAPCRSSRAPRGRAPWLHLSGGAPQLPASRTHWWDPSGTSGLETREWRHPPPAGCIAPVCTVRFPTGAKCQHGTSAPTPSEPGPQPRARGPPEPPGPHPWAPPYVLDLILPARFLPLGEESCQLCRFPPGDEPEAPLSEPGPGRKPRDCRSCTFHKGLSYLAMLTFYIIIVICLFFFLVLAGSKLWFRFKRGGWKGGPETCETLCAGFKEESPGCWAAPLCLINQAAWWFLGCLFWCSAHTWPASQPRSRDGG